MSQTNSLLSTLKHCLKAKGITYAQVAQAIDLSEASVKRMFSDQNFSLQRLDAICELVGMEVSDLVRQMEASQQRLRHLTAAQEREIAEDIQLVLVTVCTLNHWTFDQIVDYFTLSEQECLSKLLRLDKIGILQLQAENRIKLLVSADFHWLENGPLERFFRDQLGQEYFKSSFSGEHQHLRVLNGTLSGPSAMEFKRRMEILARDFIEYSQEDANLPFDKRQGTTLVMAMRHWDYGLFEHLIRPQYRITKEEN